MYQANSPAWWIWSSSTSMKVHLVPPHTCRKRFAARRLIRCVFMNKFRKLGFISYNGKIEVNSSLLNAVLYDKPEIKTEP